MGLDIKTRGQKGARLTEQDIDNNFLQLKNAIENSNSGSPWIPCHSSINVDDVGRIAMLNQTDGLAKVYQKNAAIVGTAGVYEVIFSNTSGSDLTFNREDLQIDQAAWHSSPVDADAAAAQLRDYLNLNYSSILSATSSTDTTTVTFSTPPTLNNNPSGVFVSVSDVSINIVTQSEFSIPEISKSLQLGVITDVDETNSKIRVYNGDIVRVIAGEDITVTLSNPQLLFAGNNGKAVISTLNEQNQLALLGIAITAGLEDEHIFVKKIRLGN